MPEKEAKRMQEQTKLQPIPVKIYRTHDHLTVAAPMPGLEPEDILVEVTENGQLILHGDMRAALKDDKEVLLDEWNVGGYHRELVLPDTVDGELGLVAAAAREPVRGGDRGRLSHSGHQAEERRDAA